MTKSYPRTLVFSVNAFRTSGSNGKVLSELFKGWDKDALAQFYVTEESPEFSFCDNYYHVSDRDALYAFTHFGMTRHSGVVNTKVSSAQNVSTTKKKQTSLTRLLRDIVWNSGLWRNYSFWKWVNAFHPEVIVVMSGASSFMHKIAIDVAKKQKAPLVVYNTENYYFKDYNYLERSGGSFFFPIYKHECDRMFRRLMTMSAHEIYLNKKLDELYYGEFGRHGTVIYNSSDIQPMQTVKGDNYPIITYAGNLGIDRHLALMEIGKALQEISNDYYLDVYGKALPDVEMQLHDAIGIRYHGFISYSELMKVMERSHFMVHAESFDSFWVKDLSTAFSTKLGDILCAGKCLILYAHSSFACTQYVLENNCGCVINDCNELKQKLKELIDSDSLQKKYRDNAIVASQRDMQSSVNAERFYKVLTQVISK